MSTPWLIEMVGRVGIVGFDPSTPHDRQHNYGVDVRKVISLGATIGGGPDARLDYDGMVDAVADLMSGYIPDRILEASESPNECARWVGEVSGPLAMALANRAPGLDPSAVERDALKRVMDARRKKARDEEENPRTKAMREAAEREEAEEQRDSPRSRMNSGRRFQGDADFGGRFLQAAARSARTTVQQINAANRAARAQRLGVASLDAPKPITSVAPEPKTGSMASFIGRLNQANREYTQRKREAERAALNPFRR